MTRSLINQIREKRNRAEATSKARRLARARKLAKERRAKKARELARARKLAEERRRARAVARENERARKEAQARRNERAAKQRRVATARKLAIRRVLAKCLLAAYRGNTFLIVDDAMRKYRPSLVAMGFSYERATVPHPNRQRLLDELNQLKSSHERIANRFERHEKKLNDYREKCRLTESENAKPRPSGLVARLAMFLNGLIRLENVFHEKVLLAQISADPGFVRWPKEKIMTFMREKTMYQEWPYYRELRPEDIPPQIAEFLKSGEQTYAEFKETLQRIKSLKKSIGSGLRVLTMNWNAKPSKRAFSEEYRKLFWFSKGKGKIICQKVFARALRLANKSRMSLYFSTSNEQQKWFRVGNSKFKIPDFIEATDIAERLEAEELMVSVTFDRPTSATLMIKW